MQRIAYMTKSKSIAFFDMDGTITHGDTFFHFLVFDRGWWRIFIGGIVLAPWLLLYKLSIIDAAKAKLVVFRYFFRNREVQSLIESGQ